jgi:hypothetical protein
MGLSVRTLLQRYFYLEEVKAALADIGEPSSGSKPQLVGRLMATWESHNRDFFNLLDFLDVQTLRIVCKDYGLDYGGDRVTLLRRIRRTGLLDTARRKADIEAQPPPTESAPASPGVPGIRRLRFRWPLWVSITLTVMFYFILPLFGLTQTASQIVAALICFIGVWSGLRYLEEKT